MMLRRRRCFLFLMPLALAFCGRADADCEVELRRADAGFQAGRFEEVMAALAACLESKPSRDELVQALALKAKTLLASDEVAGAKEAVAALLRAHSGYQADTVRDSPRFIALVDGLRQESTVPMVSSVSKTPESLREAPATVVVVSGEEIARRGYLDLEAVIHDLSGFDVSRSSAFNYSNLYQRGYRSDITTRTQFLLDGVVENDIWSQLAYLSRQYPLSNVERVEIIYGPASTMYGANAFAGVINVVTINPDKKLPKGERFGGEAQVGGGTWNTRFVDATAMGRSKGEGVSWSVAVRGYDSDEMDLSRFDDWDYDLGALAGTYRELLSFDQATDEEGRTASQFLADECPDQRCVTAVREGPLFAFSEDRIALTEQGLERALELDRELFGREIDGVGAGYQDVTDAWLVHGKLQATNLVLGFQSWKKEEGWSSVRTDRSSFGKNTWIPMQTWFYLKYFKNLGENLSLTLFSRYREHKLDGDTHSLDVEASYANGELGIVDLVDGTHGTLENRYWYLLNSQFANEIKVVYTSPGNRLSVVGGVEQRSSSVQGTYVRSDVPNPAENGPGDFEDIPGSNRFDVRDLSLYAQLSYRPWEKLKLVVGGRADDNRVAETGGFGTIFNPRLAVIYLPGDFTLKAIYSEAFQDATFFQKFNVTAIPNPFLAPETVANFELSAGWRPTPRASIDVVGYEARYDGAVTLAEEADCTGIPGVFDCETRKEEGLRQFQNTGALEIRGLQVDGVLRYDRLGVFGDVAIFGNYTYSDPFNRAFDEGAGARITDIASHRLNFGVSARFAEKLDGSLRMNWVGERKVGAGTDNPSNTLEGGRVDPYFVTHASLRWRRVLRRTDLQLIVNNLFDTVYYHPGIRGADGSFRPHQIPQQERAVFLRLSMAF